MRKILSPLYDRASRSQHSAEKSGRLPGGHTLPNRDISYPTIFISVQPRRGWSSTQYARARIVLRRRVYRYLVWKDNGKKCEFYMGKIKILPLGASSGTCRRRRRRPR